MQWMNKPGKQLVIKRPLSHFFLHNDALVLVFKFQCIHFAPPLKSSSLPARPGYI